MMSNQPFGATDRNLQTIARLLDVLPGMAKSLARIAAALERAYPPPPEPKTFTLSVDNETTPGTPPNSAFQSRTFMTHSGDGLFMPAAPPPKQTDGVYFDMRGQPHTGKAGEPPTAPEQEEEEDGLLLDKEGQRLMIQAAFAAHEEMQALRERRAEAKKAESKPEPESKPRARAKTTTEPAP